ncbi:hypothetical protein U9M48_008032 [Paspalum notatum var. saurae]|uniref:RRM domain-containing protein n=1 Tax=Paspalum notatum var. saurae TaxID=547442 RepID=A0AAQ3SNS8_PASNO
MTAKRGPSAVEMLGSGVSKRACPLEQGETEHPSAAELRASLSARDQEIEEMRRRLRELEKLEFEMPPAGSHEEPETAAAAKKTEVDARSIYVGNVDYACLPEEVQQHFQFCGTINRVTILTDSFGQPKGFAYVEFDEVEAVQDALLLDGTELHGRPLKVEKNLRSVQKEPTFQECSNLGEGTQFIIFIHHMGGYQSSGGSMGIVTALTTYMVDVIH